VAAARFDPESLPSTGDVVRDALLTHLLTLLRDSRRPSSTQEQLQRATGANAHDIATALDALERDGHVAKMARQRWALAERSGLRTGRIKVERSGRALVILDVPDAPLVIERGALRPAMDGDRVLVEETKFARGGLHHAKIRRVLERGRRVIVGVVSPLAKNQLLPADERIGPYVVLLAPDSPPAPPRMAVAASVVEYPSAHRDLTVRVERVLGEVGKLATEIESACLLRGIPAEFPADVEAEAAALGEPCAADFEGRVDLRAKLTMTVDPVDAKDHDDAVSIEGRAGGGGRLLGSIADVSHYVRPGTRLDAEAYERSTSTYFPGRAVPMLPERISGDLASLHPGVDRLAVTAFLDIDRGGDVVGASFSRSVIHSVASLTYEDVQGVLDAEGFGGPHTVAADARAAILEMARCADALHRRRLLRGAIDMDLPESVVELDEAGEVKTVRKRARLFAHRLVEEFMLAANEAVAERIDAADGAFLYRIHERPDDDALLQLSTRVRALGLRLDRDGGRVVPMVFQKLLADAAGRPEARQVNLMVLRTMTRARYSADKEIHFGLASRCYTHFTSPIRRYPDLVAHRALLALEDREAGRPAGDLLPTKEALRSVAVHTSDRERRAMEAERDVASAAAALYMARHVGRRLEGTVSGVDRWGFWVELDVAFVEGFVHIGKLREYFDWVPERLELQSRVSPAVIHIGQRVRVRVASVDLAARRIELEPG
jgi:ribonuclease R